jgi:hypothetical protein
MGIQNHDWEKVSSYANSAIRTPENYSSHADNALKHLWDKPLLLFYTNGDDPSFFRHNQCSAGRLLAGNVSAAMNTLDSRMHFLNEHLSGLPKRLPFLTVCSSPQRFANEIARIPGRNGVTISVALIDPRARLRAGLPIRHYVTEALRYRTCRHEDLRELDEDFRLNKDQWLCLWEITPREIVYIWDLSELKSHQDWYETIVEPALRKHQDGVMDCDN